MREDIQRYNAALDYAKVGDWRSAISQLHPAIARQSQEAEYHSLLGVAYLGCADCDDIAAPPDLAVDQAAQMYIHLARLAFHRALALNPNDLLLATYLDWLLNEPFDDDRPDRPANPSPRSPQPNFPSSSTANFIDAESITQIP
jgi:tetratricopeptide (TPR) repeat protein